MNLARRILLLSACLFLCPNFVQAESQYPDKASFVKALNQLRTNDAEITTKNMIEFCENVQASDEESVNVRRYAKFRLARLLIPFTEPSSQFISSDANLHRAVALIGELENLSDEELSAAGINPSERSNFKSNREEAERLKKIAAQHAQEKKAPVPLHISPVSKTESFMTAFCRAVLGNEAKPFLIIPSAQGSRKRFDPLFFCFLLVIVGAFIGAIWRARQSSKTSLTLLIDTSVSAFIASALISIVTLQIGAFYFGVILEFPRIIAIGVIVGLWTWVRRQEDKRSAYITAGAMVLAFAFFWGTRSASRAAFLSRLLPRYKGPIYNAEKWTLDLHTLIIKVALSAVFAACGIVLCLLGLKRSAIQRQPSFEGECAAQMSSNHEEKSGE